MLPAWNGVVLEGVVLEGEVTAPGLRAADVRGLDELTARGGKGLGAAHRSSRWWAERTPAARRAAARIEGRSAAMPSSHMPSVVRTIGRAHRGVKPRAGPPGGLNRGPGGAPAGVRAVPPPAGPSARVSGDSNSRGVSGGRSRSHVARRDDGPAARTKGRPR